MSNRHVCVAPHRRYTQVACFLGGSMIIGFVLRRRMLKRLLAEQLDFEPVSGTLVSTRRCVWVAPRRRYAILGGSIIIISFVPRLEDPLV